MNKLKTLLSKLFSIFKTEVIEIPRPKEAEPPTSEPKPEHVQKGIVTGTSVYDVRIQLEKLREARIKEEFLPSPQTKRITRTHGYIPPAEQHRDAISKAMKGKGGSTYYRKVIKTSPKIKIEEKD